MTEYLKEFKRLLKAWSVQFAALGIFVPDILQVLADNSELIPWFGPDYKSGMRLACLIAIVLLRPIKQKSLAPEEERREPT